MDLKSIIKKIEGESAFIKTTEKTVMDGTQKAALNRKGNLLYNSGDIESARRIFLTTGYSDGLIRVGDYYMSKGRQLDALRMYWIAPDRRRADPIIMQLSALIQSLLQDT
ncbi:MAG: hypothetical protein FWG77_06550 [Treponema sp.]|nr:hypothetical protein [Treponema sp.]